MIKKIIRRLLPKKPLAGNSTPPQEEVIIPSYDEKRSIINGYREKFNLGTLVETGTFMGDTVDYFKDKFRQLYSIELSEELATRAMRRFESDQNISILQGDSGKVLATLLPSIHEPALFWLDGHYSSEFFHNGEFIRTAKADKNTPVEEELDLLLNAAFRHVILIDDARLFVGQADYPTLDAIRAKLAHHPYDMRVERDIIHIIPQS